MKFRRIRHILIFLFLVANLFLVRRIVIPTLSMTTSTTIQSKTSSLNRTLIFALLDPISSTLLVFQKTHQITYLRLHESKHRKAININLYPLLIFQDKI